MICYFAFLNEEKQYYLSKFKATLPDEVLVESYDFLSITDQVNFLAGRSIIQRALTDFHFACHLSEMKYTTYGKPYFDEEFYFSISHSKDLVVGVFDTYGPVGVDAQHHSPLDQKSYQNVLSELGIDLDGKSMRQLTSFYDAWAKKESVVKADGRGMTIELHKVRIEGDHAMIDLDEMKKRWQTKKLNLKDNYSVYVCALQLPKTISTRRFC